MRSRLGETALQAVHRGEALEYLTVHLGIGAPITHVFSLFQVLPRRITIALAQRHITKVQEHGAWRTMPDLAAKGERCFHQGPRLGEILLHAGHQSQEVEYARGMDRMVHLPRE